MNANDEQIKELCESIVRKNAKMGEQFNFSVGDVHNALKRYGKQDDFATWLGIHQNEIFWFRHDANNLEPFTDVGNLFRRVDIYKSLIAFPLLIEALIAVDAPPLIQLYAHAFYSHIVNVHTEVAVEISNFIHDCEVDVVNNLPTPFSVL